jgi:hypothetical protein
MGEKISRKGKRKATRVKKKGKKGTHQLLLSSTMSVVSLV